MEQNPEEYKSQLIEKNEDILQEYFIQNNQWIEHDELFQGRFSIWLADLTVKDLLAIIRGEK